MVITLGVTLRIYNIQWPPCESHICRRNILLGVKVRVKVRVRVRVRIRIRVRVRACAGLGSGSGLRSGLGSGCTASANRIEDHSYLV